MGNGMNFHFEQKGMVMIMKIRTKLGKLFSLAMATIMGLTGAQGLFTAAVEAAAASNVYVQFKNLGEAGTSIYATVLEGETVQTVTNAPSNYDYGSPAFSVLSAVDANKVAFNPTELSDYMSFKTASDGRNILITPTVRGKDYTYIMQPVFKATLYKSSAAMIEAKLESTEVADDGTETTTIRSENMLINADVTSSAGIAVMQESKLVFEIPASGDPAHKNTQDMTTGHIPSLKLLSATGDLISYQTAEVACLPMETQPNVLAIRIQKVDVGGETSLPIDLRITTSNQDPFTEGTKFTVNFYPDSANAITMTVISRKTAVDTIADDIETSFLKYIQFQSGDNTTNVTTYFNLTQIVQKYNYKEDGGFQIEWSWRQENESIPPCVIIQGGVGKTALATLPNRPLEDEKGWLTATVKFTTADGRETITSHEVVKELIIRGQGVAPSIRAQSSMVGYYNTATNQRDDRIILPLTYVDFPDTMDVYNGSLAGWKNSAEEVGKRNPYWFRGRLHFGSGISAAYSAKIEAGATDSGQVDIFLESSPTSRYVPGTSIPNPDVQGPEFGLNFDVRAIKAGTVNLKITFYNGKGEQFGSILRVPITIVDTSPSDDARMGEIKLKGVLADPNDEELKKRFDLVYPNGSIDYGFTEGVENYAITLPWAVGSVQLAPSYFHESASNGKINISWSDGLVTGSKSLENPGGMMEDAIPLREQKPMTVTVVGEAEDGTKQPVYTLVITRLSQSDNTDLSGLSAIAGSDGVERIEGFDPIKYTYNFSLPYSYHNKKVHIVATAADSWAKRPKIEPISNNLLSKLANFINSSEADVDLHYIKNPDTGDVDNLTRATVTVVSEAGNSVVYTINITVEDPSEDNQLSQLEVYKETGEKLSFDNNQQFVMNGRDFYMTVPYSTEGLRFVMLPNDEKAQDVQILHPDAYKPGTNPQVMTYKNKGTPLETAVKIPASDPVKEGEKAFDYGFTVTAESGKPTEAPYIIHITRADPDIDARLASLTVTDEDTGNAVQNFSFNPQKTNYEFTVPYTTTSVVVTPAAQSALSRVTVNDAKISVANPGKSIPLKEGSATTVTVRVIPEGGTQYQQDYILKITRESPSNEARLQSLVVNGGQDMAPAPYQPSHYTYNVNIPEGTKGFTITATPVEEHATITVNGKAVQNGQPSEQIVTTEGNSKVKIVVTAQDGKTTKTYNLNVRDYNFIKKSSNAALSGLEVNYGDLQPRFRSNIEDYEIYVKSSAMDLELTPRLADSHATMKVYSDSRQLTESDNIYSASLLADKTVFTIEITAEDGTEKTYTLNVYRNDKKKQGNLKPITPDMVNWGEDPIVIDITNYAVVSAEIFNTLKTDYPDKTILFQGNDYTLQMKGSDVTGLVPHTNTYDLRLLFTTPEEALIQEALWDLDTDQMQHLEDLKPVYIYFDDHTTLPGKMLLTVNLGREYSNEQLFWNYYNNERDRIDYYGYVKSNAKGSFTVPLNHFSTYFITLEKVDGAESKVGVNYGGVSSSGTTADTSGGDGSINGGTNKNKDNPKTGVGL